MPLTYDDAVGPGRSRQHVEASPASPTSPTSPTLGLHFVNKKYSQQTRGPTKRNHVRHGSTDTKGQYNDSNGSQYGHPTDLPALQAQGPPDETDAYEPVLEDQPGSYDLVEPAQNHVQVFSLEKRSLSLFSKDHLQVIFSDPTLLLRFTAYISAQRSQSVPLLVYYLDALKALRAIRYANAVTEALEPLNSYSFTAQTPGFAKNTALEKRADEAFEALVQEELPAYITDMYIGLVSESISRRITGTLPPHLRDASEGLAEVFCLTDPSRRDNPIVFASEEFHRTTQYGMDYVLGRNCRFLQGPHTNANSVRRLREAIASGRQHQEVFLNYRRDGSPFMNLLMMAPLCDSRGKIRYFIGAQVDVSGLVKDCTELESFARLLESQTGHDERQTKENGQGHDEVNGNGKSSGSSIHLANGQSTKPGRRRRRKGEEEVDEFRSLAEMLNLGELSTVRKYGGRMHTDRTVTEDGAESIYGGGDGSGSSRGRLLIREPSPDHGFSSLTGHGNGVLGRLNGKLSGVYKHYLLIRPAPSLRILFASPSQRVPGILQSPFLSRIGGSPGIRDELAAAFADGRGVTAKIRWLSGVGVGSQAGLAGSQSFNNNNGGSRMSVYESRESLRGDGGSGDGASDATISSPRQHHGKPRWIHCTPLIGAGGRIGVWMVIMIIPDEEKRAIQSLVGNGSRGFGGSGSGSSKGRIPPPVPPQLQSWHSAYSSGNGATVDGSGSVAGSRPGTSHQMTADGGNAAAFRSGANSRASYRERERDRGYEGGPSRSQSLSQQPLQPLRGRSSSRMGEIRIERDGEEIRPPSAQPQPPPPAQGQQGQLEQPSQHNQQNQHNLTVPTTSRKASGSTNTRPSMDGSISTNASEGDEGDDGDYERHDDDGDEDGSSDIYGGHEHRHSGPITGSTTINDDREGDASDEHVHVHDRPLTSVDGVADGPGPATETSNGNRGVEDDRASYLYQNEAGNESLSSLRI